MAAIKSADRSLDLLELLARHRDGLTFAELLERLGWPRSSLHGLLATLTGRSFITLDETTRRYTVGIRAWEIGQAYISGAQLGSLALPVMRQIRDALNETVQLAVLDRVDNVYIAKVESTQPLTLASVVGSRLPAHVTGIGKVMLAELDEPRLRALYAGVELPAYTERTITSVDALVDELARTRAEGVATDAGEYTVGISCVAAPVRDHTGRAVAGLSVSVPDARLTPQLSSRAREELLRGAAELSRRLGHLPG